MYEVDYVRGNGRFEHVGNVRRRVRMTDKRDEIDTGVSAVHHELSVRQFVLRSRFEKFGSWTSLTMRCNQVNVDWAAKFIVLVNYGYVKQPANTNDST